MDLRLCEFIAGLKYGGSITGDTLDKNNKRREWQLPVYAAFYNLPANQPERLKVVKRNE